MPTTRPHLFQHESWRITAQLRANRLTEHIARFANELEKLRDSIHNLRRSKGGGSPASAALHRPVIAALHMRNRPLTATNLARVMCPLACSSRSL
jgi:hypothetical protein